MYYKLDEDEFRRIKEASEITYTDYELQADFIPVENLMSVIDDLLVELDNKEEKIKELENDIENNYELKSVNPYTEYGVSERDFY